MSMELEATFNQLLLLKDDPDAFERKRQEIIERFIEAQPEERQGRYRKMQWRIDQERKRFKDPIACYNRLVAMFWEQVEKFQNGCDLLTKAELAEEPIEYAKVLTLKKPDS